MHQLTTETRSLFDQVAAKYVENTILSIMTCGFYSDERAPVVLDGFGFNRSYIDDALENYSNETTVPMFLAWFHMNQKLYPDFTPAFEHACEMYLQGSHYDGEWFAAFEPIFLDEERFYDCTDVSNSFTRINGEDNWVCRYLQIITVDSSSCILEAMDHLDGKGLGHLNTVLRLSFVDTDFLSHDPNGESLPEVRFESLDRMFLDQQKKLAEWTKDGRDEDVQLEVFNTRLFNPPRGGGFSCIS